MAELDECSIVSAHEAISSLRRIAPLRRVIDVADLASSLWTSSRCDVFWYDRNAAVSGYRSQLQIRLRLQPG